MVEAGGVVRCQRLRGMKSKSGAVHTCCLQQGPRGGRELRFYELVKAAAEECTPDLAAELAALDPFGPRHTRNAHSSSADRADLKSRGAGFPPLYHASFPSPSRLVHCSPGAWELPDLQALL